MVNNTQSTLVYYGISKLLEHWYGVNQRSAALESAIVYASLYEMKKGINAWLTQS